MKEDRVCQNFSDGTECGEPASYVVTWRSFRTNMNKSRDVCGACLSEVLAKLEAASELDIKACPIILGITSV